MKIQSLAIIFIIIIMPITIVLSQYIDNRITTEVTELEYNTRLLNSTYDSIKAYQINTINNSFGDITNSKISDIEAAIMTFYNSLANNFNFTGNKADVMKEYIPAVAFTLYDGYYIYSPFTNILTGVDIEKKEDGIPTEYDDTYSQPHKITNGLKPYIYYSARYVDELNNWDFIITYTLDNYITIMGQIGLKGSEPNYVYDCGYLYPIATTKNGDGIFFNSTDNSYWFDGIEFTANDTEELKEYVGEKEYSYARINGQKYYLDETSGNEENIVYNGQNINKNAKFFYIDSKGAKNYNQVVAYDSTKGTDYDKNKNFIKYYLAIKKNKSAYLYYKKAYEFSKAVLGTAVGGYMDKAKNPQSGYNLSNLITNQCQYFDTGDETSDLKSSGITPLSEYGDFNIFEGNIHSANSNFNKHRKAIIRYVIETNMAPAISGFSSSAGTDFVMPKISETDWETIQNDVCEITFLQGLKMGSKKYNGYSVVANMLTKEYVDEDDIYILKEDNTYCKANDNTLSDSNMANTKETNNGFYPGIWKINFERKKDISDDKEIFYPLSFKVGDKIESYLGSYTSIMGSSGINEIGTSSYPDMNAYMKKQTNNKLKEVYYKALGRERWSSFNINNVNYEIYGSNANNYLLDEY